MINGYYRSGDHATRQEEAMERNTAPLEHETFTYEDGWVHEDGDRIFHIGAVRDAQELRAIITAWRVGKNQGEKVGRTLQQFEIARAMGLESHVFQKATPRIGESGS